MKTTDFSPHKCCEVSCRVYLHCKTTRLQWTRRKVIKIKLMECCYSWVSQGLMTWPGLTLTLNVQKDHKISKQKTFNFQDQNQTKECCCRAPGASSADTLGKHMHQVFVYPLENRQTFTQRIFVGYQNATKTQDMNILALWHGFFFSESRNSRNSGTTLLASDYRCKHKEEVRWAVG